MQRAAQIRYGVNWQWTAVKMQYERLMARKPMQPGDLVEVAALEHMQGVVDMDFLVTAVRRLLRVAEQARRSGCDTNADLKVPMKIFTSALEPCRWRAQYSGARGQPRCSHRANAKLILMVDGFS